MSKSHQRPNASTVPSTDPIPLQSGGQAPIQQPAGNMAAQEQVGAPAQDAGWFGALVESGPVADAEIARDPVRGGTVGPRRGPGDGPGGETPAEDAGPKDLAHRPKSVRKGAKGALIGAGETIEVRDGPGAEAAVSLTIPNGTPCKVDESKDGFLKVSFRVGKEKKTGWVASRLFSDQPDLAPDEDDKNLMQDYVFTHTGKDETTADLKGSDVEQGYLGDCFFIAAMNAVGNAGSDFLEQSIQYDPSTGMYKVRFFDEQGRDTRTGKPKFKEVWIEVDGYIPTSRGSKTGAYASGGGGKAQWGAIMEKAYAKWKGGYDVLDRGGYENEAMEELTGSKSVAKDPQNMREADVLPFFRNAQEKGLAIACGTFNSKTMEVQTPLSGSGEGPYTGTIAQIHDWNKMVPGTVRIEDKEGNVAEAWDTGEDEDKQAPIKGDDVKTGQITYESSALTVTYKRGKKPAKGEDLQVSGEFHGMLYPAKSIIGEHAYAFDKVIGETIQLYNPWGSTQPKPLTASEFLQNYSSLSTVQVPQAKTS